MYNKVLNDVKEKFYQDNFPNDGQRFVAWYLKNIHQLSLEETKDSITDGAGDKQIDAVFVDDQNQTIFIIQGKFYSGDSIDAEPVREVLSSWEYIKDLQKLQESANEKLQRKIIEIRNALDDDYEICFELVTTSQLTDAAKNDFDFTQNKFAEDNSINASLVLVDNEVLKSRYEESIMQSKPLIDTSFKLEKGKFMELIIGNTKAVVAAILLKDCVNIPGIKDTTLFRKNVRQSLGLSGNKVNKGIASTLRKEPENFFFLHNGITAICDKVDIDGLTLNVKGINVVNGCQSLTTIYQCSESVRNSNGYIMIKFYEISSTEQGDKISICTNSQSAVKARDLRSNDKTVLAMKKSFEEKYLDGYFVTKRGEEPDILKYNSAHIVYLTDLGKQMMAWHTQRPNISYSETKIFDKYFNQLFKRDYKPEFMLALKELYSEILKRWNSENSLDLNESLLAMKAYCPYHHLYAVSVYFCVINNMPDSVPNPAVVLQKLKGSGLLDQVIDAAGQSLNSAFENANEDAITNGKIFSPQNWVKSNTCLKDIKDNVRTLLAVWKISSKDLYLNFKNGLEMNNSDFETRWTAD